MWTSLSTSIFVVCIVFSILAIFTVILRFTARGIKSLAPGLDDYVVLVALVVSVAHAMMTAWGADFGSIGTSIETMTMIQAETFLKLLFASQFISLFAVATVKISILMFYKRIFNIASFRLVANIMISIVVCWFIAFFLVTMFAGDPVSDSWTHEGVPRFNFAAMLISSVATDLVLDIAVLSLPLPVIKNLHLTTKRKISVACMFWLGIFCVISSAVRLYYVVQFSNLYNGENNDAFSDTVTYIFLWSNIEPCTSVIAACLPTLGPLLQDGRSPMSLVHSIRSYWSNRSGSTLGRKRMYSTDDDGTRLNVVKNNWLNLDSDGTHGSYA